MVRGELKSRQSKSQSSLLFLVFGTDDDEGPRLSRLIGLINQKFSHISSSDNIGDRRRMGEPQEYSTI